MSTQLSAAFAAGHVFIGSWKVGQSGRTLDVLAPADGAPFAKIVAGGKADVDQAIAAARELTIWSPSRRK